MKALTRLPKVLAAIVLMWASAAAAADKSVWSLTPYRVRVLVAVAPRPPLTPRLEAELCTDLSARIEAVVGAAWNATVLPAPPGLRQTLLRDIGNLRDDQVPLPSPHVDKVLLLAVTVAADGVIMATARDFDVRTRTLNAAVARSVWQLGALCDAAFDALLSAFAPLARVDRVEKERIVLRAKAAGLPPRDRNLTLIHEGDVFRPIVRYNDRDGRFRRAAPAPWSFCTVTGISPEEVQCRIHSGMRAALTTRGRGRVEPLALRVIPPDGSTLLSLRSRTEPKVPLAGYDVYSHPPGEKTALTFVGRSDRQGRLWVPPAEESPLRMLLVKNGGEPLARLPVVPGLERQLTAEIANDAPRLAAEGFITGLQEELVDLVARRKILMARIQARIEAGQFDKAAELLDELRRVPEGRELRMRIAREQDRLTSNDPLVQRKIDSLLADTRRLIDKQFKSGGVEKLERNLRSAKKASEK